MRINSHVGNVDIKIDTKRIDRRLLECQRVLNIAVQTDCMPLVPKLNGQLRRSVHFPEGIYGGVLEYNTPYAHYQYVGRVYGPNIPRIDETTGEIIGWYSPPTKHPTGRKMAHYSEPGTGPEWFAKAKERHGDKWLRLVREAAGKG